MYVFTLPSGSEVELREMTGAEESLLTNRRLMKDGEAVNQVLKNCLVRLGDKTEVTAKDVLDLLSGDRLFVLVKLRQISFGEEVDLSLTCPNKDCGETTEVQITLDELEVTPYGAEREFIFRLPRSKKTVLFGLLDGHMEKRLATLKEPSIHSAMLMRIKELDGKAPNKNSLMELPAFDLTALRAEMQRVDGGIDTTIHTTCSSCGARVVTRLEAEPAFLFPNVQL
jgi:hypothetical protein